MRRLLVSIAVLAVLGAAGACSATTAPVAIDASTPLDAPTHPGAGNGGGTLDELRFAVVGDTRPVNLDDTANYPTAIIRQIWTDVEAEVPHAAFAVSTGDYIFASTGGHEQDPQLDLYLAARMAFHGVVYAAMGNHECNGYTSSNCGPGNSEGQPANFVSFMAKLVAPLDEPLPYFVERFAAADRSWSAKLVVIAANAWDPAQDAWLERALSEPSTYTFVLRHEGHDATTAPGTLPSTIILARHAVTLLIVGHTHAYRHYAAYREIVVGNGGAPLTSSTNYGYVIVARNPDGTIGVTSREYMTHALVEQFTVKPDGMPAP